MRNFTVIQNVLTAIIIPLLAAIVGISSLPAIYLFLFVLELGGVEASSFSEIDSVSLCGEFINVCLAVISFHNSGLASSNLIFFDFFF